jgi:hypothetical protein
VKNVYPYLRDPRAIAEIRKHQWIESEKAGREIGFGTAAVDWIAKYGEAWKKAHAAEKRDKKILLEQRRYRRFALESTASFWCSGRRMRARTVNISCLGLLCKIRRPLELGSRVVIQWSQDGDARKDLVFEGTVERVSCCRDNEGESTLLLKFNEATRKKIENLDFLRN